MPNAVPSPLPALPNAPRPRILLVEDEPTIAVTLRDDLVDEGCEVTVVGDGSEAIGEVARRPACDAVIADLRLPGADGLRVLAAARCHWPLARLLLITAHAGAVHRDRLLAAGASLLEKPFANAQVVAWLRGA